MNHRSRNRYRQNRKPGHPENGSAVHHRADPAAFPTKVHVLAYGPDAVEEHDGCTIPQIREIMSRFPVTWIDVNGLADLDFIRAIGEEFKLHPLAMEDTVSTHQRPKAEGYDDYDFIVMRMAPCIGDDTTEQISMFLMKGCVLSFQERPGDDLETVRERIRQARGRIRKQEADYLAYALIDAIIDAFFPVAERMGERMEDLEDRVVQNGARDLLAQLYDIRRRLLDLRRALWPLREVIGGMVRDESPFFSHDTRIFLRDCHDHVIQMIDLVETYRELSSNLMDVYLSSVSNHLNEIMKVLTIISVIFIPLTFLAGIYGMNFNTQVSHWNMPELNWHFGYPLCLLGMLVITIAELVYFYRKGWLASASKLDKASIDKAAQVQQMRETASPPPAQDTAATAAPSAAKINQR